MNYRQSLRAQGLDDEMIDRIFDYHKRNPGLFEAFEKIALSVAEKGKRVGAMAIINKIRWDTEIEGNGVFKINNSIQPYFARIFAIKYPQYAQVFETRKATGVRELA